MHGTLHSPLYPLLCRAIVNSARELLFYEIQSVLQHTGLERCTVHVLLGRTHLQRHERSALPDIPFHLRNPATEHAYHFLEREYISAPRRHFRNPINDKRQTINPTLPMARLAVRHGPPRTLITSLMQQILPWSAVEYSLLFAGTPHRETYGTTCPAGLEQLGPNTQLHAFTRRISMDLTSYGSTPVYKHYSIGILLLYIQRGTVC